MIYLSNGYFVYYCHYFLLLLLYAIVRVPVRNFVYDYV